ncbi:50S ribosomal protein L10 [Patescibacteria group bacterium]|nr:50S ribosomal protein L10 [Patescibacteria group bacterium]
MAKTKQQKFDAVKELEEKISRTKFVIFTNFDGLNVADTTELRKVLREGQVDYTVTKKTLLKLAIIKAGLKEIDISSLEGGLGAAFSYKDEILPAKLLHLFAKKHKALKLVGGIFGGKFINAEEIMKLALLPGMDELRGQLVWLVNYPLSGLVNVLAGNMRNLVYALNAIKEKKS